MSPLEITAFLLGVANVALVVKRSIWNYPFALAMVALYAVIFSDAKLYSDALLQVFFFVVNLYGWWSWARARADAGIIVVEQMSGAERVAWVAGITIAAGAWGSMMHRLTDASYPWWDAAIAAASIAAQILLARRKIENWLLWIAVDIAAIGLYAAKSLWLTAVLYVIFLGLSVWGLVDWRAADNRRDNFAGACEAAA
ncbi:Nicotinamide mononucleotide transporter [Sphingomonas sp. EC-HK361]|uniref:nicotinamide riboside transporter PnuC n=1 Tax=Sphingomonas sp. EC-HK361 TaxID=2038397 RepID=UPI0012550C85|nr:nicotinamide riboside transporter PnuC [Sphingomonas sp. EC-HK361]VVT19621.1 Nicotinamide mononucleotide transporter [Sphingomonas sp. EC-HK361]